MEVGKGIHRYTLGGLAIVDIIGTFAIGAILAHFYGHFILICILLFIISVPIHALFGIKTRGMVKLENALDKL